jgi:hypothetical protein
MTLEKVFKNWETVSWSIEGSTGISKGNDDVGHQRFVEVC